LETLLKGIPGERCALDTHRELNDARQRGQFTEGAQVGRVALFLVD
jgi:hypothetical protein